MTDTTINIKHLTNKRTQIKAKLTRFKTFFDNTSNQQNVKELKLRLRKLEESWKEFEAVQEQIELLDDQTDHALEREDFETQYFGLCSKVETHVAEVEMKNSSRSHLHRRTTINAIPIKLPTINLPTFSGKYDEWLPFFDTFSALIDNNENLTDIQKLHYLKACLTDGASKSLDNIDLTAANYEVAISLLKDQFQNIKLIVQNHVKALFNLPQIQKESTAGLKHLINHINAHLRALNNLAQPSEAWDTLIIYLITTKLDSLTHREWELTTKHSELPTLKELTDFLQKRCQVLENLTHNRIPLSHTRREKNYNNTCFKTQLQYKQKLNLSVSNQTCCVYSGKQLVSLPRASMISSRRHD